MKKLQMRLSSQFIKSNGIFRLGDVDFEKTKDGALQD